MTAQPLTLTLAIDEAGAGAERLDQLAAWLQDELLQLGVEEARPLSAGPAPAGAKGDPLTIGALALVVLPAVLPKLVEYLKDWSLRSAQRSVRIKTETGAEIEFTPEHPLSTGEILALVERLRGPAPTP